MRIAMLSTEVSQGGAARAMVRSADALRKAGHVVYLITLSKDDNEDNFVVNVVDSGASNGADRAHQFYNAYYVNRLNRTKQSNTLFWVPSIGFDVSGIISELEVDVINIHWTSYFLSLKSLESIFDLGLAVVFTLHDMALLTGGCHYSAGCEGFKRNCTNCPQLRIDPVRVPHRIMSRKRTLFRQHEPWVISPSPWLAKLAVDSGMFTPDKVRTISNALDTDTFSPNGRELQREIWGLGKQDVAILFGAYDNSEHRKGFDLMQAAAETLVEQWQQDKPDSKINVVVFGNNTPAVKIPGVHAINVGYIDNDLELARVYAGCDVIALPSREDNQPNVMMEGFACGVPVVAFRVGGMADYILEGKNGMLAEPFDTADFAGCLSAVLSRRQSDPQWGSEIARATAQVVDELSHAMSYLELFQTAIADSNHTQVPYEIYRPGPMTEGRIERDSVSVVEWF